MPDVFIGWRTEDFSRAHVELCAVSRAGHFVTLDFSLGQWRFLVRAGIFEGKESPLDVEERYLFALDVHEPGLTGRDLVRVRHLHKFSHALIISSGSARRYGAFTASRALEGSFGADHGQFLSDRSQSGRCRSEQYNALMFLPTGLAAAGTFTKVQRGAIEALLWVISCVAICFAFLILLHVSGLF